MGITRKLLAAARANKTQLARSLAGHLLRKQMMAFIVWSCAMLCVLATASAAAFGRKEGTLTVLRETNKEPEPRTCQGLSNYFGITSNMPFPACAPQGVRDWWVAHGCTTSAQVLRCNCGTCAPTPAAATPVIEAMRSATRAALSPAGSWTRHGTGWAWRAFWHLQFRCLPRQE